MTVKIVNLTAHNIDVYDDWGNLIVTYRPSGLNARVRNNSKVVSYINGIPVIGKTNEVIVDLPGEEEGTMYIVSNIVLNRFPNSMLMCKIDESYRKTWESFTERISVMVLGFTGIVLLWPFVIALNIFVLFSNKT